MFSPKLEKILVQIHLVVFEKNAHFNSKKMMSPIRRLGYSNNQLKMLTG